MQCRGWEHGKEHSHIAVLKRTLLKTRSMGKMLACVSMVSPAVVQIPPVIVIPTLY